MANRTRQTRFRCEKIVAAFVQLVFLHAETDGKQAAFLPLKEAELHVEGKLARAGRQIAQALAQRVRVMLADGIVGMRLAGIDQNARPFHRFRACGGFDFAIEFVHQANDIGSEKRQVDGAEGCRLRLVLDGQDGTAEIGDPLFQAAAQRTQYPAVVGDFRDGLFKNVVDIENAVEVALHVDGGSFRPFFQRGRQRNQMTGEIAAVHRRYIEGPHRCQRVGLVPVVEMALVLLHLFERIDGGGDTIQRFAEADPAEIARGDDRQQIDADIGRRRALRDDGRRVFLEIVRREMVVFLIGELGEVTPGPARIAAQVRLVGRKHFQRVLRLGRTADEPGDQRRGKPDDGERCGDQRGMAFSGKGEEDRQTRNGHGGPHQLEIEKQRIWRGSRLRRRAPFQKVAVRNEQTIDGARNRVRHQERRMGDEGGAQRHIRRAERNVGQYRLRMAFQRIIHVARDEIGDDPEGRRHEHGKDEEALPDGGRPDRQHAPADDGCDQPQDRVERAAQVVDHFPARDGADACIGRKQPWQKLPVAACPAMVARDVDIVAGRIILDHLHIADQSGTGIAAFQKVVAEERVFRHAALQRGLEGVDVVKALAGEGAFAKQVLIGVGHSKDIRIDAAIDREDALQERCFVAGRQRRRDARLENAIATDDLAGLFVNDRAVQRMAELAGQMRDGFRRQTRIGVQRHHIFDFLRQAFVRREEARILIAPQQQVQLMQLAALALPTHPAVLLLVEEAAAVQKEKARLVIARIVLVELGDFLTRIFVDFHIRGRDLVLRIGPVADQREVDFATRIGEIMHFEIANLLVDGITRGDEGRHRDQRARLFGQAFLIFKTDEARGLHEPRHQRVEQRIGRVHRREERQQREQRAQIGRKTGADHAVIDESENQDREDRRRNEQAPEAKAAIETQRPDTERRLVTADPFKLRAAFARQVIGDCALALGFRMTGLFGAVAVFRQLERRPGDVDFAHVRIAGELFDGHAVGIAGAEVQKLEIAVVAQDRIDLVDGFKPGFPIHVIDGFQAADDIAHRDAAGGLAGMFLDDGVFRVAAFLFQNPLQPVGGCRGVGGGGTQAIKEMRREGAVAGGIGILRQDRIQLGSVGSDHDAVGSRIGEIAHDARAVDAQRQTSRILDQEIAHRRRQRPQFADLQRLDGLETLDDGRQRLQREIAVRMRDIEPGQREDARHALVFFNRRLVERQLADKAARQVAARLLDVLVDLVVVVEQPLRGRGDGFTRARGGIGGAIGMQDQLAVFRQALIEREGNIARQRNVFAPRHGSGKRAKFFLGFIQGPDGRRLFGGNLA